MDGCVGDWMNACKVLLYASSMYRIQHRLVQGLKGFT